MKHNIDASGKILGRLATEIAVLLRGKTSSKFAPHKIGPDIVEVANVAAIRVSGNKHLQKIYAHYSRYPGGLKTLTYKQLVQRKPGEALRKAVYGMLPTNKLRAQMMKRLIIQDTSRNYDRN